MVSNEVIKYMLEYGGKRAREVALMWLNADEGKRKEIEERFRDIFEDYSGDPHSI